MEENISCNENENTTKKRGRKKQLYMSILELMEFYFSASNLSKDRWLKQRLDDEKAIHLTDFLRFNKIRALTQDVNDIVKALRKSEILGVTEDMKVYRTKPVEFKQNEDDYVIYIEQLPTDADLEWLSSVFSGYGKIDYISLPKFKGSNKSKGFAFIEFAEVEGAKKAIEDYKQNGNYLSTDIAPGDLVSIATYEDPKKEVYANITLPPDVNNAESKSLKKRKSSDQPEVEQKVKKLKIDGKLEEEEEEEVNEKSKDTPTELKKCNSGNNECANKESGSATDTNNEDGNTDETKKKKHRKKKSKKKKNKDSVEQVGLQILSKRDWKILRNKYLNMQREKMKVLKKHIYWAKKKSDNSKQNGALKKNEKSLQENGNSHVPQNSKTEDYSFVPGLIVKVSFSEPVIEVKTLKSDLKKNPSLKFVDLKEGESTMHLRFETAEAAEEFCKTSLWSDINVLEGEDEANYWSQIQKQREQKLSKDNKKKERGKEKLMRKAENILGKHITFD